MFLYFILFCIIGFGIGIMQKNSRAAIFIIIGISLFWALIYGPWAFVTFAELMLGYFVTKEIKTRRNSNDSQYYINYDEKNVIDVDAKKKLKSD